MRIFGTDREMNVRGWGRLAAVATVALLAGCGGGGSGGSNAAAPRTVSATLSDGLVGTMTADQTTIPVGGTVHYTLTLTNKSDQSITYQPYWFSGFDSGTGGSLTVYDAKGSLAWPLTGSANVGLGPPVTLAPGQSQTVSYTVSGDVSLPPFNAAGSYQAVGDFIVSPGTAGDTDHTINAKTTPLTVQVR